MRVGQIVRDTCPLLLYVPYDGQRSRRWSKRQTECSGRVYGNQVVARRQGQGLSSVEQKRHRWDTNAGSRGEIVTGVEQGEAARRWQVLGELHERVSERVVGLSLQSSHSGAAIYDDSSFATPVDLEDGGRDGELLTADAHPCDADVVERVHFAVFENRRGYGVTWLGRVEFESRRVDGVAVDEAVRERGGFDLRSEREWAAAKSYQASRTDKQALIVVTASDGHLIHRSRVPKRHRFSGEVADGVRSVAVGDLVETRIIPTREHIEIPALRSLASET